MSIKIIGTGAYLPEKTWFIEDSYHAMFELEDYAISLCAKLLFTNELKNVHSDPAYPQFEYSDNVHQGVHAKFNNSLTGYVASEDTALKIRNLYENSAIRIVSVVADGLDIEFDTLKSGIILPGKSVELNFSGDIPQVSATRCSITVNYVKVGMSTGLCSKTFDMTINNGKSADKSADTVELESGSMLEAAVSKEFFSILKKLTVSRELECIFDTVAILF